MSRTNDLGIMQLNAPTGSVTSADQIWDWRENVRRGMDELTGKQRTALQASRNALESDRLPDQTAISLSLLNFCRGFMGLAPAKLPPPAPLSPLPGTGVLPDDPDVDHLKSEPVGARGYPPLQWRAGIHVRVSSRRGFAGNQLGRLAGRPHAGRHQFPFGRSGLRPARPARPQRPDPAPAAQTANQTRRQTLFTS